MGMYTELNICLDLNKDVPSNVVHILNYMMDGTNCLCDSDDKEYINDVESQLGISEMHHPLFDTERWEYMLYSGSYYFDGFTHSEMKYDNIGKNYKLNIRCNLKDYGDEIYEFLDWLCPYVHTTGFLGYTRYEEYVAPTLIYKFDNMIKYQKVTYGID